MAINADVKRELPKDALGNIQSPFTTKVQNKQSDEAFLEQLEKENENFLKIMLASLKHQDPEKPFDASQLVKVHGMMTQTKMLAGMSRQIHQLNKNMEKSELLKVNEFQGQQVSYDDSTRDFADKPVEFNYELKYNQADIQKGATVNSTITIVNEKGLPVFTTKGEKSSGLHRFTWNGKDNKGNIVPNGRYTIKVSASQDITASGKIISLPIEATSYRSGIVESVEIVDGVAKLRINGTLVDPKDVRKVTASSSHSKPEQVKASDYMGYVGKKAEVTLNQLTVENGAAEISFINDKVDNPGRVIVHIYDQNNKLASVAVHDGAGQLVNTFKWDTKKASSLEEAVAIKKDGKNAERLADGKYRYEVFVEDLNNEGQKVKLNNQATITITGVDMTSGAKVSSDLGNFDISAITKIEEAPKAITGNQLIEEGSRYIGKRVEVDTNRFSLEDNGSFSHYVRLSRPAAGNNFGDLTLRVLDLEGNEVARINTPAGSLYAEDAESLPTYNDLDPPSEVKVQNFIRGNFNRPGVNGTYANLRANEQERVDRFIAQQFRAGNLLKNGQVAADVDKNMGRIKLEWNGIKTDGSRALQGEYQFEIITTTVDAAGTISPTGTAPTKAALLIEGSRVDSGEVKLILEDGREISPEEVKSISL